MTEAKTMPKVRCTDVLADTLMGYDGILETQLDYGKAHLKIVYDPRVLDEGQALQVAQEAGHRAWEQVQHCAHAHSPMCKECALKLQDDLSEFFGQPVQVELENGVVAAKLPRRAPMVAEAEAAIAPPKPEPKKAKKLSLPQTTVEVILTVVTLIATLLAAFSARLGLPSWATTGLYVVAYVAGGYFGFVEGVKLLITEREIDVDLLMILAALGAALVGQPTDGAILLFLFSLSNTLQSYALGRTRQAIEKLMDLRPPEATVKTEEGWKTVPVEELRLGDIVMVRPGERFPIDGEVVEGTTEVDQSPITGESVPVFKQPGDPVFAGTVNTTGTVEIRVTHLAQESTLAKIVQMVEEAQDAKAKTQRMLEEFEGKYAKFVLLATVVLIVVPTFFLHQPFSKAFYRAMTWLVVASPCALVISTPATILSAIANGARHGVLFKGGAHLERTATLKVIAFDKTGTLTVGEPQLQGVYPAEGLDEDTFLRWVAALEARSEHPIARAIVHAAEARGLDIPTATEFRAIVGQGVEGVVEGTAIWVGNERMFSERSVRMPKELTARILALESEGQTVITAYRPADRAWLGLLTVADTLRPEAPEIVKQLHDLGIEKVVMLTGDNQQVAASIASQVGVDEFYAELLPKDKVRVLERLQKQYGPTAMVGDGVNDAPALALADVGIAMGGAGTDVALETADVVLMADDLNHLPYAIGLAREARKVVWQNITFAMAVIVLLVASAFGAGLTLPWGVVGHEGSTVIVVLNGLRLLRYKG
ncbi:MAG: cadmium-translocating P-type ATPase [Chloroflexi bacterium]|nr:cadmium-translocating P-type ATPase [Chloroflexota bacterium]